jgi:hypothetical protein
MNPSETDMSNDISPAQLTDMPQDAKLLTLRRKIGWICQMVRVAAPAYAAWVLYLNADYWSNAAAINNGYGRLLQRDLSAIAPWQQASAFGVDFVVWLFAAYACYSSWRLFTLYLAGDVLTPGAALWLRRLALYGTVSQILSIVTRPLVSVILTLHFPANQKLRIVNIFFQPNDLAFLLLLFVLLALAHIQKSAAEIASEHAQFV